jgi:hypothetical protein
MGDSHIMTSINDQKFPNAYNIAQEGEPYPVTYFKLRNILKDNTFDTLILGFSPHNISEFNDHKFSKTYWANELFDRIYSILSPGDLGPFQVNKFSYGKAIFKNMLVYPKINHRNFIGHYKPLKETLDPEKQNPDEPINRHFYNDKKLYTVSATSIAYLDSIRTLSASHNMKVILISSPVYPKYKEMIPERFSSKFDSLSSVLSGQDIPVYDLSGTITQKEYFANFDHLNAKGSDVFTQDVRRLLQKKQAIN